MDASKQAIFNRLESTVFPGIRRGAVGCAISARKANCELGRELNSILQELPAKLGDDRLRFAEVLAIDHEQESRVRPESEDYPSPEQHEAAEEAWDEKYDMKPKPWFPLGEISRQTMVKQLEILLSFSPNDYENADQQPQCLQVTKEFSMKLADAMPERGILAFESDHLLLDESIDAANWGLFYDEVSAFVSEELIAMVWVGRDRHYG